MPRALFEGDFPGTASRAEFAELLRRAKPWFELPLVEDTVAAVAGPGPARDCQYAPAGAFVARHSHVLVALWDGARPAPGSEGGTATVVQARLEGDGLHAETPGALLDSPDRGPVFQVMTPRASHSPPPGTPYQVIVHTPRGSGLAGSATYETIWERSLPASAAVPAAAPGEASLWPDLASRLHTVVRRWVTGQATYFRAAARRDEARHELLHGWARRALRVGAVLSGLLLLLVLAGVLADWSWVRPHGTAWLAPDAPGGLYERVRGILLVLLALAAVVAALLHNFGEKGALSEHARQYARMGLLFAEAERRVIRLLDGSRLDDVQALLAELGREALAENGDWFLLHRERPLEVPER
jgi:hypothetical protein